VSPGDLLGGGKVELRALVEEPVGACGRHGAGIFVDVKGARPAAQEPGAPVTTSRREPLSVLVLL
jgi:hypothetical protein